MRKVLHAALLGLIGAGIVHVAIIILLPLHGGKDLLTKLATLTGPNRFMVLDAQAMGRAGFQAVDPDIRMTACRFSIAETPVRLTADGNVPFWSVSIFDTRGVNVYSINDQSADREMMDVLVASPLQLIALKKVSPDDIADTIIFEHDMDEGFAVLRVLRHEDSWSDLVDRFLVSAECGPYAIPDGADEFVPAGDAPAETSQTN